MARKRFSGKRKRSISKVSSTQKQIREINKDIREVNKMLDRLYRHGEINSWASKRLLARIENIPKLINKKNKKLKVIDENRKLRIGDIRELKRSLDAFQTSETATISGIRRVEERTLETIKNTVSTIDEKGKLHEPTKKETEALYNLFNNKDFNRLTETIKASDLWILLNNAKEMKEDSSSFVSHVSNYVLDIEDDDIKKALEHVYQEFLTNSEG